MSIPPLMMNGILLAIVTLVLAGAMQANWRDVAETIRRPVKLFRAWLAVNIVVPLAAILVCLLLPIDVVVKLAIIIMAVSPLAPPVSLKLIGTGADASRIAGYFALLTVISILFVPLTLAISSVLLGVQVGITVGAVAQTSIVLLLAPVAIGVTVGTFLPNFAAKAVKPITVTAYAVLGVVVLIVLVDQARAMASLAGDGSIIAMIAISLAAVTGGHLLGGPDPRDSQVFATAAVIRHPGISLLIVSANALEDRAVTAVLLFLVINIIISALYQRWADRQATTQPAKAEG